jgi:hypothetical protein
MGKLEGWKAVWVSRINNYDDLDEYTEDSWDDNGERSMSLFAKDFAIDWYDPDNREFDLDNDAQTFEELFSGVSHEDKYVNELIKGLGKLDPKEYKSFMVINNYKHDDSGFSPKTVFIGNYKYK